MGWRLHACAAGNGARPCGESLAVSAHYYTRLGLSTSVLLRGAVPQLLCFACGSAPVVTPVCATDLSLLVA
jgi:hypothetical protein